MRPTTKDLARVAGVSRATVDRVLNERPGVQEKTIRAVNAAIEELGFVRNMSAANLAKGRVYRLLFLLPRIGGEFLQGIEREIGALRQAVRADNVEITIKRSLSRDPHKAVQILSKISLRNYDGVALMAPETPQVRDATLRLTERGVHVVQLISGQPEVSSHDFVGIDNYAAGATAGRLLGGFCRTAGRVMVITDTMASLDSAERRLGFDTVLQERFPDLIALPTIENYSDPYRTDMIVFNTIENFPDIVGVYVMSSEAVPSLEAVFHRRKHPKQVIVAHELTPSTAQYLQEGRVDALITQHTGHAVRSAVRLLRARVDGIQPMASQEDIRIEILLRENLSRKQFRQNT